MKQVLTSVSLTAEGVQHTYDENFVNLMSI